MDFEARARLDQLEPQVHQLQSQLKEANDRLNDQAGRSQELAAKVAKLEALLVKAVDAIDSNTAAFRDTIQILDAKTCVHEAVIRDIVKGTVKTSGIGQLDADAYFNEWKQQLAATEAEATDPYEGAVMFGGDYDAQVDGTPEQDPARRDGGGAGQ